MKIIQNKSVGNKYFEYTEIEEIGVVKKILDDVKKKGDIAVRKYSKKFDGLDLKRYELTRKEIKDAYRQVDKKLIRSLKHSARNIETFSKKQFMQLKNFQIKIQGNTLGQSVVPLEKIGCYVPGGRYPLPSTALMCVIPAKIAGVKEIIVCSPKIKPATIVAADIARADRIFNVGGIQAIGAMAFGTETIPKVDKIVGPGNKYVTAAKKEVYGAVGIDFLAGPSEVLIIADDSAKPEFIAADILAQTEHDPNAKAYLVTVSMNLAKKVNKEIDRQLRLINTKQVAKQSTKEGLIVIVPNLKDAVEFSNKKAPEHLELQVKNPNKLIPKLTNYGSLFIGEYSAEVFGDYCSGTNHTLPTNGTARYTGGLSAMDFVKILTYQRMTKKGAEKLIPIAATLASAEGLEAHENAAKIRKHWKQK